MREIQAQLLLDARCTLAEGPVYDERHHALYWTDLEEGRIHLLELESGAHNVLSLSGRTAGSLALTDGGNLLAALDDGIYLLRGLRCEPYCLPAEGKQSGVRYNDGKCDPSGRFVVGTAAADNDSGLGCLFSADGRNRVQVLCRGLGCSNGLAWSRDGRTMYHVDTLLHRPSAVSAFDYDPATGAAVNRRQALDYSAEAERGIIPDGMTIDREGNLWIAEWGGWGVACWNPKTGEKLARVAVPAERVSCCTFGGKELDTLFITTAAGNGTGGSVFTAHPGVAGFPTVRYLEKTI